jgi:hypothetical protein
MMSCVNRKRQALKRLVVEKADLTDVLANAQLLHRVVIKAIRQSSANDGLTVSYCIAPANPAIKWAVDIIRIVAG